MDFMIENLNDFEEKCKELSFLKETIDSQALGYIKNGIECAIEKKRYRFLPSSALDLSISEVKSYNFERVFGPIQLAYSLLESQVLLETGLSQVFPKFFISGDSSPTGSFTKSWTETLIDSAGYTSIYKRYDKNIFDETSNSIAKAISNSDKCFKSYVRRGLLPLNHKSYYSSFDEAKEKLKTNDLGYLLPLKLFSIFKRPLELSGNLTDSKFAVLVVFTDGKNLENDYFALMYFKCPESC